MPENIIQIMVVLNDRAVIIDSEPKLFARGLRLWDLGCEVSGGNAILENAWVDMIRQRKPQPVEGLRLHITRPEDGKQFYVEASIKPRRGIQPRYVLTGRILMEEALLTNKEREVLKLLQQEKTTQQIARAMNVRDRTVLKHIESIKEKTGAKTMFSLGQYAAWFRVE